MQDSNIRLYDSLYSGGIPRLLQAQIACLMSTEHDEINVHVVAVQSQVIANKLKLILFMYVTGSSLIKRLIQVENKNSGFLDYTSIFRHCSTSVQLSSQRFTPNKPL